ncbi:MAG: hypothetical protein ACO1O6_04550 [Bacteroidota bacterium]
MKTMKRNVLGLMLALLSFCSFGQKSGVHLGNGSYFTFKNGAKEWSEPVKVDLSPTGSDESIPLSIRIKVKKRMVRACHYYVEITNLSDTKKTKFLYGNNYTDASGKQITHKVKLKSKGSTEGKIIFAQSGFKPKEVEDCLDCSWELEFFNVKIK